MENTYTVSQAAKKIGVSVKTLQRWDRDGILVANRTPSNRRYYTENQLNEAKGKSFDMNGIIETIKYRYANMKNRGIKIANDNIMGHIVLTFCNMQDAERESFFDNYDSTEIENERVSTCDIMIDRKFNMSILAVPENISKDTAMKWLYNYMKKTKADKGMVIVGTEWNLVDTDGDEYSINFDGNINSDVFKKFMI